MLKQILISSLIAIAISLLIVIGFYSLIPLSVINPIATDNEMFGTSLTTISGSDTVQNALKVIANDNFTALNAGKIEISTTTLPLITTLNGLTSASSLTTVGTIGTGVWNATALTVTYGGTGSTTLSSNQVLLGNGTGILKTVAGFGASGQFLTSTGAGSAPTWATPSVNETVDYTWTGLHSWFATTTMATTTIDKATINDLTIASSTFTGSINIPYSSASSSSASVGYVGEAVLYSITLTASDTLQDSADTSRKETETDYVVKKIFTIDNRGTVRVSFTLSADGGATPYGKIYKNGIAAGAEKSGAGTYTDDYSVTYGDTIEVWIKSSSGSAGIDANVSNFRLSYTKTIASPGVLTTDEGD